MGRPSGRTLSESERRAIGATVGKPISNIQLAREYKCTRETIAKWRKRGAETDPHYSDALRPGRPHKKMQATKDSATKEPMSDLMPKTVSNTGTQWGSAA